MKKRDDLTVPIPPIPPTPFHKSTQSKQRTLPPLEAAAPPPGEASADGGCGGCGGCCLLFWWWGECRRPGLLGGGWAGRFLALEKNLEMLCCCIVGVAWLWPGGWLGVWVGGGREGTPLIRWMDGLWCCGPQLPHVSDEMAGSRPKGTIVESTASIDKVIQRSGVRAQEGNGVARACAGCASALGNTHQQAQNAAALEPFRASAHR